MLQHTQKYLWGVHEIFLRLKQSIFAHSPKQLKEGRDEVNVFHRVLRGKIFTLKGCK